MASPNLDRGSFDSSSQNSINQSMSLNSSSYFRNVKPWIRTTGYVFSEMGGPIMTFGMFHGFARKISGDYFHSVRKYPSGALIFLTGLALRVLGNSLIENYTTKRNN